MPASRRGYHHNLLHDNGGADIHNYHCSCHHYVVVHTDLFDHRADNDDLHRAGYEYVYDGVPYDDEHLDYHYPAPHHDHGGVDIFHDNDDGRTHHYGDGCDDDHGRADYYDNPPAAATTDDDDLPPADDLHVYYDPDEYEYVDQHDDDLATR